MGRLHARCAPYPSFWGDGGSTTNVTFYQAGTYTLEVNVGDGAGEYEVYASSSVVVTVGQALTSISVTPGITALASGASETLKATGLDQFGRPMLTQPAFTWSALEGTITPAGLYTSNGTIDTVTVAAGSTSDDTVVYETAMVPTVASPAAANPAAVTGTSTALSVLGADASDSSGEACLSYTWSVTALPAGAASPVFSVNGTNAAKTTTATFASAGHYSFLVTIGDPQGLSVGTSVNVTVGQSFEAVDVTPGRTELGPGQTRQFTAEAEDQFGDALNPQPAFTWSAPGGTISTRGLFTAPAACGDVRLTASSGSVAGTATVNVMLVTLDDPELRGSSAIWRPAARSAAMT